MPKRCTCSLCCARAGGGHAAAAPPKRMTNSRRLFASPPRLRTRHRTGSNYHTKRGRPREAANVNFGSKADMCSAKGHVRSTPESGHVQCNSGCPLCATSGHAVTYSIASSARASKAGDTVRPNVLAVLRLIVSSYLVGACTGSSFGFSPFSMRSTYPAARRYCSRKSGP